jgi:hypothetical protein
MITGWWCNNHPEDMKVNGKDDIPYVTWTIKFMFETSNQLCIVLYTKATVDLPSGYLT